MGDKIIMASIVRKNVEKFLRITLEKLFAHKHFRGYFSEEEQEKFITRGAIIIDFILAIATMIVMIWFFQRMYKSQGFEKTIVIMLTIMLFVLRNFLEVNAAKAKQK